MRQRELVVDSNTSQQKLENAETLHASLESRIQRNEDTLVALDQQRILAQQRLDEFVAASTMEAVDVSGFVESRWWAVEEQRARLDQLKLARQKLVLRSPIRGVVVAIHRRPGEVIAPGDPVVSVIEPIANEIVAVLDESRAGEVSPGMVAHVVRRSDRSRTEVTVLRTGMRMEALSERVTGDPNVVRFGLPVYLPCPKEWRVRPNEAFDVTFVR